MLGDVAQGDQISIHVLREEDDNGLPGGVFDAAQFLSTSSARRTTVPHSGQIVGVGISIHVLREEDDVLRFTASQYLRYFYPRPPRGGRRSPTSTMGAWSIFLSTSSARRTTISRLSTRSSCKFLSTSSARRTTS